MLPYVNHALIEDSKLAGYSLNKKHPKGKEKARLFESMLGYTDKDIEEVKMVRTLTY